MAPGDRWFFDRVHPIYDLVMPAAQPRPLREALALADGSIERVVDVGGGTGRASKIVDASNRIVVDVSRGMLRQVPADIERVLGSATDLPLVDGAADAVIVVDALHHLPQHQQVFAELYRVLRAGGVVVLRDFNGGTLRGRLLAFGEHAIGMESTFRKPAELLEQLDSAGFTAEYLQGGFTYTVAGRKPGRP